MTATSDRCMWKRCRATEADVICTDVKGRDHPLCWRHHVRLMGMEGISSENILKHSRKGGSK